MRYLNKSKLVPEVEDKEETIDASSSVTALADSRGFYFSHHNHKDVDTKAPFIGRVFFFFI